MLYEACCAAHHVPNDAVHGHQKMLPVTGSAISHQVVPPHSDICWLITPSNSCEITPINHGEIGVVNQLSVHELGHHLAVSTQSAW